MKKRQCPPKSVHSVASKNMVVVLMCSLCKRNLLVRLAERAHCSQPELYGIENHVVSTLNSHDLKISSTKYPPITKTSTKRKGNRRLRTCRNQKQNEGCLSLSLGQLFYKQPHFTQ
jgi:hypothetical protein